MAPFIDNQNKVIYAIYFVSILVPITLYLQPRPERPAWANPAQYRQLVSHAIRRKRWGTGLLAMLVVTILVSSIGGWYANKKEELVPSVAVQAQDGLVQIPLDEVSDGHLHRYASVRRMGRRCASSSFRRVVQRSAWDLMHANLRCNEVL